MSKRLVLLAAAAIAACSDGGSQFYVVAVEHVDQDTYRAQDIRKEFHTRSCPVTTAGKVVVRIDGPAGPHMGKIWFSDDRLCNLVDVIDDY